MWKFRWNELRSQHENIIGMTCADFETSEYYRKETECASAELRLMRKAETELYPVAKWEDVNSERHEFVKKHISFVEVAAHASVMLKSHKKATQARASEMVFLKNCKARLRIYRLKRQCNVDLLPIGLIGNLEKTNFSVRA